MKETGRDEPIIEIVPENEAELAAGEARNKEAKRVDEEEYQKVNNGAGQMGGTPPQRISRHPSEFDRELNLLQREKDFDKMTLEAQQQHARDFLDSLQYQETKYEKSMMDASWVWYAGIFFGVAAFSAYISSK